MWCLCSYSMARTDTCAASKSVPQVAVCGPSRYGGRWLQAGQRLGCSVAFRDIWVHILTLTANAVALVVAFVHADYRGNASIAISMVWCIWNMLPPVLLLVYVAAGPGRTLKVVSHAVMLLSGILATLALGLLWALYPRTPDFARGMWASTTFHQLQLLGT
jgi:hypothetical protein